jgi:hypothetical protein
LKQKIALGAALLVLGLTASGGSLAQPVPPYYRGMGAPLPPDEIVTIVRSMGLDPIGRPARRGGAYSLHALDPAGREIRVELDARRGRVLRIGPVAAPRFADLPPPHGRPPGLIPDGSLPDDRPGADAPDEGDGPSAAPPRSAGEPMVPGRGSAASQSAVQSPPLPRPRPRLAATHSPAAGPTEAPAAPPASQASDDNNETTAAIVTSADPAWHRVEQQE